MKKPQKSKSDSRSGNRSSRETPARAPRHAKREGKPVTIDLEANVVKNQTGGTNKTQAKPADQPADSSISQDTASKPQTQAGKKSASDKRSKPDQQGSKDPKSTAKKPEPRVNPSMAEGLDKTNPGRISGFAAAILGGLVALAGAGTLQHYGLLPSLGTSANNTVSADALEKMNSRLTTKIAGLEKRVADADLAERVNEFQQSLSDAKSQITDLSNAVASGAGSSAVKDQVSQLSADLDILKQRFANPATETEETRLALKELLAAFPSLSNKFDNLERKVSDLQETTGQLDKQAAAAVGLPETVADLSETVSGLKTRVDEHKTTLVDLVKFSKNGADKKTARALAAAALKNDIDRGLPFVETLAALKTVAPETDFSPLEKYSNGGIPTRPAIIRDFDKVRDDILSALTPQNEEDTLTRLLSGARGLVKIKPLEAQSGSKPEAVLSRIEMALKAGDFQQASAEWSTLPDKGKEVSRNWHDSLKARIAANSLLSQTVQTFLLSQ